MTPEDLKAWQASHGYTYDSAAKALGIARATFARLVSGEVQIDRRTALACAAISAGLDVPQKTDTPPL